MGLPSQAFLASRTAAESGAARSGPADAFALAMRTYLGGVRVDMGALAEELGVARTTLYRWTGHRDELLVDIHWALTEDILTACLGQTADLAGAPRMLATIRLYLEVVSGHPAYRAYVERESHAALRLLTTRGDYQDRLIARVAEVLGEEEERSGWSAGADLRLVASTIVHVNQSFLYNHAVAALEPRIGEAIQMLELVLAPAATDEPASQSSSAAVAAYEPSTSPVAAQDTMPVSGRVYGGLTAQERHAQRRRALLDAGLQLFGTQSYRDITVSAIVAEAAVTRRTFYDVFGEQEALLRAVHDEVVAGNLTAAGDLPVDRPATAEEIAAAIGAIVSYFGADRRRAQIQFETVVGVSASMEEHRRVTSRALADRFAELLGERAGADPISRRLAAGAFLGLMGALFTDWLWQPDYSLEQMRDELVRLLRSRFFADDR